MEPDAEIAYQDLKGKITRRKITIFSIQVMSNNDYLLKCFCHLRQEERTFKATKILEFIDLHSGELIENIHSYIQQIAKAG